MNQGKYVICAMVGVGLAMAVFAWWARYSASQRILAAFGPNVAVAVRNGKTVELLTLSIEPSSPTDGRTLQTSDGQPLAYIVEHLDISDAAGLIHARHHLLQEKGFEWEEPSTSDPIVDPHDRSWTVALRFIHGSNTATWLFDLVQQRAYILEQELEIGIAPIAPSLKTFFDQIAARADTASPDFSQRSS